MLPPLHIPKNDKALQNDESLDAIISKGTRKPKAVFLVDPTTFATVYGPDECAQLREILDINPVPFQHAQIQERPDLFKNVEIIMTSWGGVPSMTAELLDRLPNLRAVFFASGSVRSFVTPEFWKRDIAISSAYAINALPVAEYVQSVIVLSLKRFWSLSRSVREEEDVWGNHNREIPGVCRSTIGLLSFGMTARRLVHLLKPFDVRFLAYDPFVTEKEMADAGVEACTLQEVFERSDVVSIHTPLLPQTTGMVNGKLIDSMKIGATLVNTSRGAVLCQEELAEVLERRVDLTAVLDVVWPEPPAPGTSLLKLPNVWITPHIAGSLGNECRRLGRSMVEELRRYLAGEPLLWGITEELVARLA